MKKILMATAVAAILSPIAATADTTVYGALRMSALVAGDENGSDLGGLVNNASRIGIKGSYGDEGGLTGFFNIQGGADTDTGGISGFTSRFAMAGVKGGFGTVLAGRASSPYKMAGLKVDPFYDTSAGSGNGGSNYGLSRLTNGWLNNVVGYVSPKVGGAFTFNAVAVLNKNDTPGAGGKNLFNPGVSYSANGITANLQHITELKTTRLALGYKAGPASVGLSLEDWDSGANYTYLSGSYKVAPKTKLAASYGKVDGADGQKHWDKDGSGFSLGVFQTVAPKTTVTAIYSDVDADANANDRSAFSVGLIQKF